MKVVSIPEQWWEIHPAVNRANIYELIKRLGIDLGEPHFSYHPMDFKGKFPETHYRCPIHPSPGRKLSIPWDGDYECSCFRKRTVWDKPLHFLAAFRKVSLEEALPELCRLFPPS